MKNIFVEKLLIFLSPFFLLIGCSKNDTNYFADTENDGIAIFSNTGNNLLTCFINGKPWRTEDRIVFLISPPRARYEMYITKQVTSSLQDTLTIQWTGYYTADRNTPSYLSLTLPVAKTFGYKNLAALQGQRLQIDTTNGFFSSYTSGVNMPGTNISSRKGAGNIYFKTAEFDSIGPGIYSGKMSGLFDADFVSAKITKGRFDHLIAPEQVLF